MHIPYRWLPYLYLFNTLIFISAGRALFDPAIFYFSLLEWGLFSAGYILGRENAL